MSCPVESMFKPTELPGQGWGGGGTSNNVFVQKSKECERVTPAVICGQRAAISDRGRVQLEMPFIHSSKGAELRTGNTGLKFVEVWADDFKPRRVDEIP